MLPDPDSPLFPPLSDTLRKIRERTPARILAGRSGAAYRTSTQMELREAHAAARDAVRAELDLESAFGADFVRRWNLFEAWSESRSKEEYLLRPDLGRQFSEKSRIEILRYCPRGADIQFVIGDGLSVTAVSAQVPALLPLLHDGARSRGWTTGKVLAVHHCRVGILNQVGELLAPKLAILLIGERPGLATAESLSAYMAYEPTASHTDANRNLISNIHARGLQPAAAADRILEFAAQMMMRRTSGVTIREQIETGPQRQPTILE